MLASLGRFFRQLRAAFSESDLRHRSDRWTRRLSWVLIWALLIELVAPAAWTLPEPPSQLPPASRLPRRSGGGAALDPQLARVLKKHQHPLPELPGGAPGWGDWFPDPHQVAYGEPTPAPAPDESPTPPAEDDSETEPEPRRYPVPNYTPPEPQWGYDSPEPPAESPAPRRSRPDSPERSQPAEPDPPSREGTLLVVDPELAPPKAEWSRQTSLDGRYYPMAEPRTAFSSDERVHLARDYNELGGEETIQWDWRSPLAEHNVTSMQTAASVQWKLRNLGSGPSSLDSKFLFEARVYDRRSPTGRLVFRRQEPTQLCQLRLHAALAPRDLGTWQLTTRRNGQTLSEESFQVAAAPEPAEQGWSRRRLGAYKSAPDQVFYTNDEFALHKKTYPLPEPQANGQQSLRVLWDWLAPASSGLNDTRRHSYASLETQYQSDGSQWTVETRVYDPSYPKGHLLERRSGDGRLSQLPVAFGKGFPTYGTWRFRETLGSQSPTTVNLEVRQIKTSVATNTPALPISHDQPIPYHLTIETLPSSWNPSRLSWKLNLRAASGQSRLYSGTIDAPTENVQRFVQLWDCRDEEGHSFLLGSTVDPQFVVGIPEEPSPVAARSAARQQTVMLDLNQIAHQHQFQIESLTYQPDAPVPELSSAPTSQRLALASSGLRNYTLTTPDGSILIDDVLRLYVNGVNVYTDPSVFASFLPPVPFQASPGDSLRVEVEDWFGGCRGISGPLLLIDDATGEQQILDPTGQIDGCGGFPPRTIFYNRTFTINIPATPDQNDVESDDDDDPEKNKKDKKVTQNDCGCPCHPNRVTQNSPLEVNVTPGSGLYSRDASDLVVATRGLPLALGRVYHSQQGVEDQPQGWNWTFQDSLLVDQAAGMVFHRTPEGQSDGFLIQGSNIVPARGDLTERLRKIDDRHFELTYKNHLRALYEIPTGLSVTDSEPDRAVLQQLIDRNGNTQQFSWDERGRKLYQMEGPVAGQFIRLHWRSGNNGPLLVRAVDHTGRTVHYRYSEVCHPLSPSGRDDLLTRVVQPGGKTYDYGYHSVLGKRRYVLLTSHLNGVLQEKLAECDNAPGVLLESTHRLEATLKFSRVRQPDESVTTRLTYTAATGMPENQDQVWTYQLDHHDMVISSEDPLGNKTLYEYSENHDLIRQVDPRNHETRSEFDARRNLLATTDHLGRVTRMAYDALDNVISITDARGGVTTLGRDANHNVVSITDPAQHTLTIERNEFGQAVSVTDALGHTQVSRTFDELGFVASVRSAPASPGATGALTTFRNDALGRPVEVRDPLNRRMKARYDERNHLIEMVLPAISAQGAQQALPPARIRQCFDENDLLREVIAVDGARTRYSYDSAHRLVALQTPGNPVPTRLEYDARSNLVKLTNSNSQATTFVFDRLNRNTALRYPGGDGETFAYDANSNLVVCEVSAVYPGFPPTDQMSALRRYPLATPGMFSHGQRPQAKSRLGIGLSDR